MKSRATMVIVLTCAFGVFAQDTNSLFQTQREAQWADIARFGAPMTPIDLNPVKADALATNERRPAEKDPDGHWGSVVDGIQLGIRSGTNIYHLDGKIPVYAFERNTTTNPVAVPHWASGTRLVLMLEDESGAVQRSSGFSDSYLGSYPLAGKLQIKSEYDLKNCGFGLKPGLYKIWALPEGFPTQKTHQYIYQTNRCSGILTIQIVAN